MALHIECRFNKNSLLQCYFLVILPAGYVIKINYFVGLSETRTEEERRSLVDHLFQVYEDRIAEDPANYSMDYVHAYIVLEKRK